MPCPPIHKTNQAKLQAAQPSREIRQFEKAVARALKSRDDEDESDTELLETDESSDDENDTPSDLPGCLLALKGIKDKMLSLTDDREPQKFVEDKFLQYVKSIKYTDDRGDNGDVTIISNTMLKQYIYLPTTFQRSWLANVDDNMTSKDMREKFYVLNQELEQSHQLASATTEREEDSQPSTSKHKHTSFTQTQDMSCSRLSARVEYFEVCDPQSFNDLDFNIMDGAHENYLEDTDTNIEPTRKRKRTAGDYPLASWLPEQDAFILEMLRLEGRGDFISQATCHGTYGCSLPAEFRCEDCFGTELYCQSCTVDRHHEHPLHRIK
ncbi:hypothetical protein BDR07DRAFT_1379861, partial [Suillus spraguei]